MTTGGVDPKRIAVAGHGEGPGSACWRSGERNNIAAVVSIAPVHNRGVEPVLEQQRLELEGLKLPAEERERRIALQQQVNSAVLTGKGWEACRRRSGRGRHAVVPEPAHIRSGEGRRQTCGSRMLFVHGALDRQVPVAHVERLSDAARKESNSNQ